MRELQSTSALALSQTVMGLVVAYIPFAGARVSCISWLIWRGSGCIKHPEAPFGGLWEHEDRDLVDSGSGMRLCFYPAAAHIWPDSPAAFLFSPRRPPKSAFPPIFRHFSSLDLILVITQTREKDGFPSVELRMAYMSI